MKHTTALNQNYMFRQLYSKGLSHVGHYMVIYTRKNRIKENRLGITATKKLGNAVKRNKARRLIKEAYRLYEDEVPKGFDYVIVARQKCVYAKFYEVEKDFRRLINSFKKNKA